MARKIKFRDALQISPERVAAMNEHDLNVLMTDLFVAQSHRAKSSVAEIRVNTEANAADDGCDGWTPKPNNSDEWLGDAETCWQFKAGTAGEPARLDGEIAKPIARKTIAAGGRFVLVASGCVNGRKGEESRCDALKAQAASLGLSTDKIFVIGSERLTTWCNANPAVAARWAGRPEGLWTLSDWAGSDVHQAAWKPSSAVDDAIRSHQEGLDFETGTIQHLHIYGHPGVGKTRLALETCRNAPWSSSVVYVPQAGDWRVAELIDSAANDAGVRLVVVADEAEYEHLRTLRDSIGRSGGRIRLITIGHSPSPDPTRTLAYKVTPLERAVAEDIVSGWFPAMPREHVEFVVKFADGYVRLARLAADAVAREAGLHVRDLLDRYEIRSFLDGMLGTGDRRALHVVAALDSIGWNGDAQHEGEAVAKHLGLSWNDVRTRVEEFHKKFGIVPRGGRYRYISPTPLGTHLAVEAWTACPDLMSTLPEALPTERAKEAYYQRLRGIASNPQAREYATRELESFFRLDDFVDARSVRRWSALSASDPDRAAHNIVRGLENTTVDERRRIARDARRETVWALVRLAWRPTAFRDAVVALALLAEAENENWGNNATAEFVSRFQVNLGGTALPYVDRLPVLDELAATRRPALMELVIAALARAAQRQVVRMGADPPSDQVPNVEWRAGSPEEVRYCVLAAVQRLVALTRVGLADLQVQFISASKSLVMSLRERDLRPAIVEYFCAVDAAYPGAREQLRRIVYDLIRREERYWRELSSTDLSDLRALHERFRGDSLEARLRQYVGTEQWDEGERTDLQPLAREVMQASGGVTAEWGWLTSGEAGNGWQFGAALAEVDEADSIASSKLALDDSARDLRVLCGYIHAKRQRRGNTWYDDWVEALAERDPVPFRALFEVAWRCGITARVAELLAKLLRGCRMPESIVGQLHYGAWVQEIDGESFGVLLRALVAADHTAVAVSVLERRLKSRPDELVDHREIARRLATSAKLIRSADMTSYHWREVSLRLVGECAPEIAAAIVREQGRPGADVWFIRHSEAAHVLRACAEKSPDDVWAALEPVLSSASAHFFAVGFPRGALRSVSPAKVLAWVAVDPQVRAPIVARVVPKDFARDSTIASVVLGAYGDVEEASAAFFSEYVSGAWTGPASERWTELSRGLSVVAEATKLPKLRRWALEAVRQLQRMADRDREREAEDALRFR